VVIRLTKLECHLRVRNLLRMVYLMKPRKTLLRICTRSTSGTMRWMSDSLFRKILKTNMMITKRINFLNNSNLSQSIRRIFKLENKGKLRWCLMNSIKTLNIMKLNKQKINLKEIRENKKLVEAWSVQNGIKDRLLILIQLKALKKSLRNRLCLLEVLKVKQNQL
jgi:hypothetical protein